MNAVTRHAEPALSSASPRSFLAFDFGTRRIGVASGNSITREATPLTALDARGDAAFSAIAKLIDEWQPALLVVGVPRHPDGQPHEVTAQAERFARRLEGRFRLSVVRVDERYSTVEAESRKVGQGGRADLDARSAAVILEQYFHESLSREESAP
jgi:putative holliday junction resolvase